LQLQASQIRAYRRQQVEAASPGQLVLIALEQGVAACRRGLRGRAQRVVEELIGGLDFEVEEVAAGMLALYDWALRLLREGRCDEAGAVLEDLRAAWATALIQDEEARHSTDG
jgi:flagellin-specific chaperone FliS